MVDPILVFKAMTTTAKWTQRTLQLCLGYLLRCNAPLPMEFAFILAQNDERSISSVVVARQPDRFKDLFGTKFRQQYPSGFYVSGETSQAKIEYRAASAALANARNPPPQLAVQSAPNADAVRRQLVEIVTLWNGCVEELRGFEKACRRAADGKLSAEMYEALPLELRTDDHPELGQWEAVITATADERGWSFMPVSRLAQIKEISVRPQLTKKQSERLLATADAIGIAIEPDVRLSGKLYGWHQSVAVYRQDPAALSSDDEKTYRSAAILLRLGIAVAAADGSLDEVELNKIATHLDDHFTLSPSLNRRLEALRHLLVYENATDLGIARTLQKALPIGQRRLVGQFLVGIANADGVVTVEERQSLDKVYRSLGLTSQELDDVIFRLDAPASPKNVQSAAPSDVEANVDDDIEPAPTLNLDRIRAIREQTARVQELLHDVLSEVEASDASGHGADDPIQPSQDAACAPLVAPNDLSKSELENAAYSSGNLAAFRQRIPEHYRAFFDCLIRRPQWTTNEVVTLAREQKIMLNAAIEVLNEWSTDCFGDWLIDHCDETLVIQIQLLEAA